MELNSQFLFKKLDSRDAGINGSLEEQILTSSFTIWPDMQDVSQLDKDEAVQCIRPDDDMCYETVLDAEGRAEWTQHVALKRGCRMKKLDSAKPLTRSWSTASHDHIDI